VHLQGQNLQILEINLRNGKMSKSVEEKQFLEGLHYALLADFKRG
jgi:hypothetical protein